MPDLFRHPSRGTSEGMRDRQPCVYLLASGYNGTLYTGVTSDLIARIHQHREETTSGFTARHGVKFLVWFELHEDMPTAIPREKTIKKWPRQWKVNVIEETNPHWNDLAVGLGFEPLSPRKWRNGPRNKSGVTK